jgi:GTP cyclohydrolase I
MAEMTGGYQVDVPGLFTTFDDGGYDELVALRDIEFASLCEHHLLPFSGVAHVAYLPDNRIVGLSKLARVVDAYARRLQTQELLTVQVADAIMGHLNPRGVAVVVEATHLCMALRGVRKAGATMTTSCLRGTLANPAARAETMALLLR